MDSTWLFGVLDVLCIFYVNQQYVELVTMLNVICAWYRVTSHYYEMLLIEIPVAFSSYDQLV